MNWWALGTRCSSFLAEAEAFREAVMDAATLRDAALKPAADRHGQAHVGVGDHQPYAGEATLLEGGVGLAFCAAVELGPEILRLAVTHLEAQQLPEAIGVHSHGNDHCSGADLKGHALPAVEVGGIEVDVPVAGLLQRTALLPLRGRPSV
jgi:hypothetical protein